ncbi:tetratricopeptide repeat domain-containing protein PYG7, chloroplastic-like isoform X2 [Olea europaea var. sylvestris]|uniref:tetratricopeptide repeat domain-containing protein PYG7, chloroplastic-like isoform X2 n=1 Tax=Olea europaea var. sylvestris TaxID=158386 RepID=UPI000C1CFB4C|nr:tetratricopeptide repeat domain-containing protein PYG7, chloroplastic-like isoform X2 [Olea europaea var. sylvestris]
MLIQCTFSPPSQHSYSTTIFIPNLKPRNRFHPISGEFSVFHSNGTALCYFSRKPTKRKFRPLKLSLQTFEKEMEMSSSLTSDKLEEFSRKLSVDEDRTRVKRPFTFVSSFSCCSWLIPAQMVQASEDVRTNVVYEVGELFELGIQLSYLLLLLALLGVGTFFVIRQVLMRRELDLSAKELQVSTCIFLLDLCK